MLPFLTVIFPQGKLPLKYSAYVLPLHTSVKPHCDTLLSEHLNETSLVRVSVQGCLIRSSHSSRPLWGNWAFSV